MRFIVFYNDHPKVQDFSVRVWHQFQSHPNFSGDMTHALFIKHYKFNPQSIACLGNVLFNSSTKRWEFDRKRHLVVPLKYREKIVSNKMRVLEYMNNLYKDDNEMISFSLKEQEIEREINRLSFLKKRKDDHII